MKLPFGAWIVILTAVVIAGTWYATKAYYEKKYPGLKIK